MLLGKEIKKTVWSITFLIFMIALAAFQAAQGGLDFSDVILAEPGPGEDYGIQQKEVPELIMPAAFRSLWKEFEANEYTAYPIGFYKNVKLGDADREKMAGIISALSGIPAEELSGGGVSLSDDISYEEFRAYMRQADDLIGGGSNYSEDGLLEFSYAAMNYEDAVESYQLIAGKDKFTGAYARLFCDYAGIILSILPVFPAVSMCLKDRRAKMNDLIYIRRTPSCRLVLSRYFAIILAVMLPAAALAYLSNMTVWGKYGNMELDYLAPLKYAVGWLLPSVMIAAAVGLFFTELTGTPVAIAIQGLWWLTDLNAGARRLRGAHTLFELMPRHNSLGNTRGYLDEFQVLAANRLLVAAAALLLVAATLLVYEQKRKGKFGDEGKSKGSLQVWQIAKVNFRHNFLPWLASSVLLLLLTPVLFGTTGLDHEAAAVPLEMFISVIGIILLTPVFWPEQDKEIQAVVASKYIDITCVYFIRAAYSVMSMILLVLVFSLFMFVRDCEITAGLIGGTIADAMFLGAIGLFASAVTDNLPVSLMAAFLYYVLNLTMKSRLGSFNLFAMMSGDYRPNTWLLIIGVIFIAVSILGKGWLAKKR